VADRAEAAMEGRGRAGRPKSRNQKPRKRSSKWLETGRAAEAWLDRFNATVSAEARR
jgi:hypothetical protein